MSETQNPPVVPPVGGTPPVPGGPGSTGDGSGTPPPGSVSYETHRQLLDEKKRADARLRQLEDERAARERADLEAKGDFEKLLAQERERNAKLTADLQQLNERETGRRKLASVLGALNGHVESKYFELIPIDDVIVDPTSGDVDQTSVARVVEKVRTKYPEIIKATSGPGLPNAAPQGGVVPAGKIKRSDWNRLSSAEMRKWKSDQVVPD